MCRSGRAVEWLSVLKSGKNYGMMAAFEAANGQSRMMVIESSANGESRHIAP